MYKKVYVEITNICNMRCSFCHSHSRAPGTMCKADFQKILEALRGQTQFLYYHLMGEPLLHPQLPEFISLAREQGFSSIITTNGTLLPRCSGALLSAKPHKLNISIHSFQEGGKDAHLQYLQQVCDFAKTAAAQGILISLRLWNRGADNQNDDALQLLHRLFPEDWTENSRGYRLRDRLFLEWGDRFRWPDKDAPDLGEQVFCYGLRDQFGILCDGTVVPCCLDSDGVLALGNIFETPLSEILASPRAKAIYDGFSRRIATQDLCRRCGYARRFSK